VIDSAAHSLVCDPCPRGPVYANDGRFFTHGVQYIRIDNFLPLPDGQLGTAMLQEAPCIRGFLPRQRTWWLDYEIHPREFSMNDLLGQLADAVDCLIATCRRGRRTHRAIGWF
jgi:hypothetical protein